MDIVDLTDGCLIRYGTALIPVETPFGIMEHCIYTIEAKNRVLHVTGDLRQVMDVKTGEFVELRLPKESR